MTEKEAFIEGFKAAADDLMPGYEHSLEYLEERYDEWQRRQA
jgi:hypothetical protein